MVQSAHITVLNPQNPEKAIRTITLTRYSDVSKVC